MSAKAIAVLGTGSDVGKSLIAAGLCRLFFRAGMRVAPFKAQNMSNNSFVTPEGGEIGRAQALQAEACGLAPHVDMNPILLKPESDCRSQVIVLGKVLAKLDASAYFEGRSELFKVVQESYARLAAQYDIIVIEGAGSAAEVNLRERDLVNWPVAQMADAQVLLVADIDRGGVFAQVVGTLDLLRPHERARIRGVVINKFRGDARLFRDGVSFLERRTGIPVLGVVPFLRDLALDQEDSLDVTIRHQREFASDRVNIAVILLPHLSNFTDFNALAAEGDVAVRYVADPAELADADVIIIPGSKNTISDMSYLLAKRFGSAVRAHVNSHKELVGICGGYQMLGRRIMDPHHVEEGGEVSGLGFLNTETALQTRKWTTQVEAQPVGWWMPDAPLVHGYRIHMGQTSGEDRPCFEIRRHAVKDQASQQAAEAGMDGAMTADGLVWGTYIHGVFDQPAFRRLWLNRLRARKGWPPLDGRTSEAVSIRLSGELDRWADYLKTYLDLAPLSTARSS
jgi:adenosylcobyric acid synthase